MLKKLFEIHFLVLVITLFSGITSLLIVVLVEAGGFYVCEEFHAALWTMTALINLIYILESHIKEKKDEKDTKQP